MAVHFSPTRVECTWCLLKNCLNSGRISLSIFSIMVTCVTSISIPGQYSGSSLTRTGQSNTSIILATTLSSPVLSSPDFCASQTACIRFLYSGNCLQFLTLTSIAAVVPFVCTASNAIENVPVPSLPTISHPFFTMHAITLSDNLTTLSKKPLLSLNGNIICISRNAGASSASVRVAACLLDAVFSTFVNVPDTFFCFLMLTLLTFLEVEVVFFLASLLFEVILADLLILILLEVEVIAFLAASLLVSTRVVPLEAFKSVRTFSISRISITLGRFRYFSYAILIIAG